MKNRYFILQEIHINIKLHQARGVLDPFSLPLLYTQGHKYLDNTMIVMDTSFYFMHWDSKNDLWY